MGAYLQALWRRGLRVENNLINWQFGLKSKIWFKQDKYKLLHFIKNDQLSNERNWLARQKLHKKIGIFY